jgi:hypothetical protein
MAKKLTPKARVLKRWPNASICSFAGPAWCVYAGDFINRSLNVSDRTPQQAWAQAAKHPTVRRR